MNTLNLRRRIGETVLVGTPPNQVTISVRSINEDEVTLAFRADREVPIDRLEVYRRKKRLSGGEV